MWILNRDLWGGRVERTGDSRVGDGCASPEGPVSEHLSEWPTDCRRLAVRLSVVAPQYGLRSAWGHRPPACPSVAGTGA